MAARRINLSPFLRQTVGTVITSVLTIFCLIGTTSILAHRFGPEAFGAYSLIRRLLNTLEPWVTLSMGISISRFAAISKTAEEKLRYLRAGFVLLLAILVPTLTIGLLFPGPLTKFIFHSGVELVPVFYAFLFLVAGYSFYVLLYAYYRGMGNMLLANSWQMAMIAVGPFLMAFWVSGPEHLKIFLYGNGALLAVSLFAFIGPLLKPPFSSIRTALSDLVRYGTPRLPGGLIYGAILTLGPMGASYMGSLKEAGYLVIGQSLLKIYEGGIEGLTRVVLPAMSLKVSQSGKTAFKDRVSELISFLLDLGFFLTLHTVLWTDAIVTFWLGEEYTSAILPVQIMALALCPYLAYVTLKAVLDAIEERALTTYYMLAALIAMILSSAVLVGLGLGALGFALGTSLGLFVLGGLCTLRVCKDFGIKPSSLLNLKMVFLNLCLAALVLALKMGLYSGTKTEKIGLLILIEVSCIGAFLYPLNKLNLKWYQSLKARVFS